MRTAILIIGLMISEAIIGNPKAINEFYSDGTRTLFWWGVAFCVCLDIISAILKLRKIK